MDVRVDTVETNFETYKDETGKHLDTLDTATEENSKMISDHYQEHLEKFGKTDQTLSEKADIVTLDAAVDTINDKFQKSADDIEIRAMVNSMTEHIANEERRVKFAKLKKYMEDALTDMNKDLNKRIDHLDLVTTHENTVNRAAIDGLDVYYKQAVEEIAESIDSYIGVVNDTSNKQYEDFNKNLKAEFSKVGLFRLNHTFYRIWSKFKTF